MSPKVLFRWIFTTSLAVIILLLWVGTAPVHAQCGEPPPSSCVTCHAQEDPLSEKGEWHIIHASMISASIAMVARYYYEQRPGSRKPNSKSAERYLHRLP